MLYLNGKNILLSKFPNGELNLLDIQEAFILRKTGESHHFVLKYENDSDLMALYFVKNYLDANDNKETELSIAYMPYSRMDRAETPETPFMLKYVCSFINDLGFNKIYVHEAHSEVTIRLLKNVEAIYDNVELIQNVMKKEDFASSIDYLVFPDKGAYERYNSKITSTNLLIGEKTRDFTTGEIKGLELQGDYNNVNENSIAIIVDDLSSYGGTFVRVSKELRSKGFSRVVLLVCHAENSIFKGELFGNVDKVYTTDSLLTEHDNWENLFYKYQDKLHVFEMIKDMKEGKYL